MAKKENLISVESIKTAEQLEIIFPDIVKEIRLSAGNTQTLFEGIGKLKPTELRQRFPELFKIIVKEAVPNKQLDREGFYLDVDDPYAHSILRGYNRCYGRSENLPIVLGFDESCSRQLLTDYIFRAEGGCRADLAAAARNALSKCRKVP